MNKRINYDIILNEEDFNLINNLIIKYKFSLNDFINIKLKKIELLIIKRNYFEFKLLDENKFKNYYLNYDLSINNIIKYKKTKIEGLSKLRKNKNN